MNQYRIRPLKFPWPPFIYVAAAFVAYNIHNYVPVSLPISDRMLATAIGGILLVLGVFLDLWALKTLHDRGTTVMPNRCASYLVTCGPFRFTRNPIYLGYTLSLSGVGLLLNIAWLPLAALASAVITYIWVIRREELHLLSRFGFEFENYRRRARCWI